MTTENKKTDVPKLDGWTIASYVILFIVTAGVMYLSWEGLSGFGREQLKLGDSGYLLPLSLDGMTVMFLVMSVSSTVNGDSATGAKFLVYLYAGISAVFNGRHAWEKYEKSLWAVGFYIGLSLSVALALHWLLKHTKRAKLRELGVLERPIARFRAMRWTRFPFRTFRAWSMALEFGITDPDEAWNSMLDDKNVSGPDSGRRIRVQSNRMDWNGSGGSPAGLESSPAESGPDRPALPGARTESESSPELTPAVQSDPAVQSGPAVQSNPGVQSSPEPTPAVQSNPVQSGTVQLTKGPDSPEHVQSDPEPTPAGPDSGTELDDQSGPEPTPEERAGLEKMTKAERVQWTISKGVRPDASTIRRYLLRLGYPVGRSTIFDTLKKINEKKSGPESGAGLRAVQ